MNTFKVYTIEGKEAGTMEMPGLFTTRVDQKLIHRYITWVRSTLRDAIAHTKTRSDVRGGGKKPWKQKGTGRARVGSSRNPVWRHGGVVFGPRNVQTFATRLPRQERRKAFMSALSAKAAGEHVIVLDDLSFETPKTSTMLQIIKNLPGTEGKKVLHIHSAQDAAVFLSTRNIQKLHSTTVAELNVLDVMNHDLLLMTKESVAALEKHFAPTL